MDYISELTPQFLDLSNFIQSVISPVTLLFVVGLNLFIYLVPLVLTNFLINKKVNEVVIHQNHKDSMQRDVELTELTLLLKSLKNINQ